MYGVRCFVRGFVFIDLTAEKGDDGDVDCFIVREKGFFFRFDRKYIIAPAATSHS